MHENFTIHRLGIRAVEILQYRRLLVGKSGTPVRHRVLQRLGGGAEYVGSDREGGIRGIVEYPQLSPQPCEQFIDPERLGDVVVGPRLQATDDIFLGIQAGQHDDGHLMALPTENGTEIAPIAIRHSDVEYHRVDAGALGVDGRGGRIERRRGGYRRISAQLANCSTNVSRSAASSSTTSIGRFPSTVFAPAPGLAPVL